MSRFTNRSYDICATGAQDTSTSVSATGVAAAAVNAIAPADAAAVIYVTGIIVTSTNPAATVFGAVALSGVAGGPITFQFVESNSFGGNLQVSFADPLPASGVNQAVTLAVPGIAGGGVVSATLLYYKRPE